MGERTAYPPGAFCRIELSTTDVDAAVSYYAGLLGWDGAEAESGHVVARLRGREVAGVHAQGDAERAQGLPPLWYSYVCVADAGAAAQRVGALGGRVLAEPFDVVAQGRMAVVLDPAGAVLDLWQPGAKAGAELVNEPGTWCWNTLTVSDPAPAQAFYAELFGWTFEAAGPSTLVISLGGDRVGGIQVVPAASGIPPNWSVAFAVADIGEGHRRALDGGGHEIVPPQDVGIGHYSVVADPQGAGFGLYAGLLDP